MQQTESANRILIDNDLARVTFDRFTLQDYDLYLRIKRLPESTVEYDWETDRYTVTTAARFAPQLGADIELPERQSLPFASHLFDYQRWATRLALDAKRFAVWADTGLGKTSIYLEWARQVHALTGGKVLILAPLPVIPQVQEMSTEWYGNSLPIQQLHTRDALIEWCQSGDGFAAVNYEKFIPGVIPELRMVAGLVADESSILRTGGGVIKWNLIKSARGIEYKLSATATPAPNEVMEYASQAAFLEKLRNESDILWTYFQRDKRGEWTVKPHARHAFYRFMASWSLYLRNPARFGFEDILSTLPEPEIIEETVPITTEQQALLSEILTINRAGLWADDRVPLRVRTKLLQVARGFQYVGTGTGRTVEYVASYKPARVAEIVRTEIERGPVIVWTTFDEEGEIISRLLSGIPHATISGSMSPEKRLEILNTFRDGEFPVLISKPQLLGYGLNLQFVKGMVFSGFDDSFERMYQAVRRAYRFGQTETVRVYTVYVRELEGVVFDNIQRKEAQFMHDVDIQERMYREAMMRDMPILQSIGDPIHD